MCGRLCAVVEAGPLPVELDYEMTNLRRTDFDGTLEAGFTGHPKFDPVVMSLGKLAVSVAPMSDTLALEILDETVGAANRSMVDTTQGRTGFDPGIFRTLAPKNETRVIQAANDLKDALRQITALAAIYQWKAKDIMKKVRLTQAINKP